MWLRMPCPAVIQDEDHIFHGGIDEHHRDYAQTATDDPEVAQRRHNQPRPVSNYVGRGSSHGRLVVPFRGPAPPMMQGGHHEPHQVIDAQRRGARPEGLPAGLALHRPQASRHLGHAILAEPVFDVEGEMSILPTATGYRLGSL